MHSYILKKYDKPLIEFNIEKNKFNDIHLVVTWISSEKNEMPERIDGSSQALETWLRKRMIPKNRAFVREILASQGLDDNDLEEVLNICMALSINDVYWVVKSDFTGTFADFNLYDHSFSEALSLVAFTGYSETIKELSPSPEMTTNGMLPKAWRRIDNRLFLYKGGTDIELYTNGGKEPYSEYYAAQIAQAMGIQHVDYDLEKWKGILASVCENFTTKDVSYVPFGYILDTFSFSALEERIQDLGFMEAFRDMIMFDALINNEDRHYGNFGLLKDNHTNEFISFAPLFDHGISLFSYVKDDDLKDVEKFHEYQNNHNFSALGVTHDKLISWFCTKEDAGKLRKLYDFRFVRHPFYNLSEERLSILESYVHEKAMYLTNLLQKEHVGNIEEKEVEERLDIHGEFLGYRYQFTGDDRCGGTCLIMNKDNVMIKNFVIKENDLVQVDAITYIEDMIENENKKWK